MAYKVSITHIRKLDTIIDQLRALQEQLPVESDAKAQITPAIPQLQTALDMLKDEFDNGR